MSACFPDGPTLSAELLAFARLLEEAAAAIDVLYAAGTFCAAEDLDALVTELEELLEDNGDYEEGADLENDLLSEVDENGAHEVATELPEDETHDDDLDFAWERGPYDPRRWTRRHHLSDDDTS